MLALVGSTLVAASSPPLLFDDAFAAVASPKDIHAAVVNATVAMFIAGPGIPLHRSSGFFVWKGGTDGRKRVYIVTAGHSFQYAKPGSVLEVAARQKTRSGTCEPEGWAFEIFDRKGRPLWLEDKKADVAVFDVGRDQIPCGAISVSNLATKSDIGPVALGDEVFMTGYPSFQSPSSSAMSYYALLMPGHVAGSPVLNNADSATGIWFNAPVLPGCSGAPVYWFRGYSEGSSPGTRTPPVVLGVTTQVLAEPEKPDGIRAAVPIGFAALAAYARELIEKAK